MCIINEPAKVTGTQLLVAPNADRSRQLTVYCNRVQTDSPNNVMLLPVPYPETFQPIDLSKYSELFSDLERSFKRPTKGMRGLSANSYSMENDCLPVFDVGSYRVTLCPRIEEIERINPQEFGRINPSIQQILARHYPGCGFVVCKLKPGKEHKYHPFAYTHRMIPRGQLFVPTRHQHNNEGHDTGIPGFNLNFNGTEQHHNQGDEELESDWDHEIYSFNTDTESGNRQLYDEKIYMKGERIPFNFGPIRSFNKYQISGHYPNGDMYFALVK